MKKKTTAKVIRQENIATGIFDLYLETDLCKDAGPGQFISLYPKDASTLLPRPISICQVQKKEGALRLVYRVMGKGTTEFSSLQKGDDIDILGVLGNGFSMEKVKGRKLVILGGGIGIPPMLGVLEAAALQDSAKSVSFVAGYRDELFLYDDLKRFGGEGVYAATEDGSFGRRGNVLDVLAGEDIACDLIYACGPMPMLRAVRQYAKDKGVEAYISLEERMACGVGACLGCVCKTKDVDPHSLVHNSRICTDGPVYNADDVEL